jgi:ubiquinone/menaquinone biosynthesis C-methylase UbiE
MNLNNRRNIEQKKYKWLSQNNILYGSTNHGKQFIQNILPKCQDPLIDIGCGRNNFTKLIKNYNPNFLTIGIDFAFEEADIVCSADSIPLDTNFANTVTSFDFFEHLLEDDITLVIDEIIRIGSNNCLFFATISNKDSINRGPNGETLHPTVKSKEWWLAKLNNKYLKVNRLNSGLYQGTIVK